MHPYTQLLMSRGDAQLIGAHVKNRNCAVSLALHFPFSMILEHIKQCLH